MQSPTTSLREELTVFSDSPGACRKPRACAQPYACVWSSRVPTLWWRFSKPQGNLILLCSPVCLPQLLSSTPSSHQNNQLPPTVFNKAFHTGQLPIRSNKVKIAFKWGLQGLTDKSNNDSSLRIWLWKNSNPILFPPGAARWLVFTVVAGCWFLSLLWNWRGRMRTGQVTVSMFAVLTASF